MYHVHMVYFFLSSAFEEKNTKILPEDNCKTRKYTRLETGYSVRDAFLIYQVEKKWGVTCSLYGAVPYRVKNRIDQKIDWVLI